MSFAEYSLIIASVPKTTDNKNNNDDEILISPDDELAELQKDIG